MIVESAILIHIGVNFMFTPPPVLTRRLSRSFQDGLDEFGVDFDQVIFSDESPGSAESAIIITRALPNPLDIRVIRMTQAPIGRLLITSPNARQLPSQFSEDAKSISKAFERTWPQSHQVVARDASLQYLFESTSEHAFKELWEERLHQTEDALNILGPNVLGGGLRFVMPPISDAAEPCIIEVKIESFLQDSKKLFVQTDFKWPQGTAQAAFEPGKLIDKVDLYVTENVIPFIKGVQK